MTLVIAAIGKKLVVVGTDSRGTYTYEQSPFVIEVNRMDKLKKISNHVCILTVGSGEFGESLVEEFREIAETNHLDGISTVFNQFRDFCLRKWREWFLQSPAKKYPDVNFIVAGLDKENKQYVIPNIFGLDSESGFAPKSYKHGFASSGIDFLATYLLNKGYKKDMERKDLCPLIAYTISETASIDSRVGGRVRIAVIEPNSTIDTLELEENDVKRMIREKEEEILKTLQMGK